MQRIPLVKTIYTSVQDLTDFVSRSGADRSSQVVVVKVSLGETRARLLGFVTREDFDALPPELGGPDDVAVYMPMSYQVGGYTLFLPRDSVQAIDMTMDQAMRFAVTAGMTAGGDKSAMQNPVPEKNTP